MSNHDTIPKVGKPKWRRGDPLDVCAAAGHRRDDAAVTYKARLPRCRGWHVASFWHATNQPTNQPTNQTTNQPNKQTNNQPTNQPTKQTNKQTNKQTINYHAQLATWIYKFQGRPRRLVQVLGHCATRLHPGATARKDCERKPGAGGISVWWWQWQWWWQRRRGFVTCFQ